MLNAALVLSLLSQLPNTTTSTDANFGVQSAMAYDRGAISEEEIMERFQQLSDEEQQKFLAGWKRSQEMYSVLRDRKKKTRRPSAKRRPKVVTPVEPRGRRGLLLRTNAGLGFANIMVRDTDDITGFAVDLEADIGHISDGGFMILGKIQAQLIPGPSAGVATSEETITVFSVGGGFGWLFDSGMFFTAGLGTGYVTGGGTSSDFGICADLTIGKEWIVADNVGLQAYAKGYAGIVDVTLENQWGDQDTIQLAPIAVVGGLSLRL